MSCAEYESLKMELFKAMKAEDEAHFARISPERERVKRMQDARFAVEMAVNRSRWHIQECEQCRAEGNEALERAPL